MGIKLLVSPLSRCNNEKWRIRVISKYFQNSEVFEFVVHFMSLSTETIQYNKEWNSVTNPLQPFITYNPYGFEFFPLLALLPCPTPHAVSGQNGSTGAVTWK